MLFLAWTLFREFLFLSHSPWFSLPVFWTRSFYRLSARLCIETWYISRYISVPSTI